jgi:flagellar biogenesis protein FliO
MPSSEIFQSVLTIVSFLLVFVFLSILLKRLYSNRKISQLGIEFKILGKLPLTHKATLFIVKIGSRVLLLGVSENSVSALADVTQVVSSEQRLHRKQIPEDMSLSQNNGIQPSESSTGFKEFLKETFRKSKN